MREATMVHGIIENITERPLGPLGRNLPSTGEILHVVHLRVDDHDQHYFGLVCHEEVGSTTWREVEHLVLQRGDHVRININACGIPVGITRLA